MSVPAARRARRDAGLLAAGGIVLLALNLRTIIASLPPLLNEVRADLGLSATVAGLLTTLPVVCFGLLAPLAATLGRRISLEWVLVGCAGLTAAGAGLRGVGTTAALFAGSLAAGAATAVGQSALPTLIRTRWPERTGPLVGVFSMALPLGATLAAAVIVPLERLLGGSWQAALAVWAVPAVVAAVAWIPSALRTATRVHPEAPPSLWRERLGWSIALFFGIQSAAFYAGLAWLPSILQAAGWTKGEAGTLQALNSLVSAAPAFVVPVIAARRPGQAAILVAIVAPAALGVVGLWLLPGAAVLWVMLFGAGQGGALGLGLILPALRAEGARQVAALTGMTLGIGYLVSSCGPWILGAVHDATGGWTAPLLVLLAITLAELVPGLPATRPRHVGAAA